MLMCFVYVVDHLWEKGGISLLPVTVPEMETCVEDGRVAGKQPTTTKCVLAYQAEVSYTAALSLSLAFPSLQL